MQRTEFSPSDISDWMYIDNGYLVGGYSTREIRKRMTSEERNSFDKGLPYKIKE